jgi:prepilin-type N-terminal cleavage/methylation domain-containing protein
MKLSLKIHDQSGFTLIEIICVLVIISVISAMAFTKILQADQGAQLTALNQGTAELNVRENVTWAIAKINTDVIDDTLIWSQLDKNLGNWYSWVPEPKQSGSSTLRFKETEVSITRLVSSNTQPGKWRR